MGKEDIGTYIAAMPEDAYGKPYRIGGKILSEKFGVGTVIGVARGSDGSVCTVCNFRAAYRANGHVTSRWRTWLVRASEGAVVPDSVPDGAGEDEEA